MKVGIVTIAHGVNYGNRLQNYAVQNILKSKGYKVETIRHTFYSHNKSFKFKMMVKKSLNIKYDRVAKRLYKFQRFDRRYIKFSKYFIKSGEYDKKIADRYDAFVCGSDQVWNPNYFEEKDSYFLSFAGEKKKVALSASFGVATIEDALERKRISNRLNELDFISVRESSAVDIVKELSRKKAELLLDPTFCLTADSWRKIERKPKIKKDKEYILCYLLGNYPSEKIEILRKKAAAQNKLLIILEEEYSKLRCSTDEEFAVDPSEFVWLVRNSDMVISDSFHATVFSIIFKKNFSIVRRETSEGDISSRIVNLIEIFKIKNPYYEDESLLSPAGIDYDYVEKKIEIEKDKFINFVEESLK